MGKDTGQTMPATKRVEDPKSGVDLTTRQEQKNEELKRKEWQQRAADMKNSMKNSAAKMPTGAAAAGASMPSAAAAVQSAWSQWSSKLSELLDFVSALAPDIPGYGTIIAIVVRLAQSVIADVPLAVQTFDQIKNTVQGGTPPDQATLDKWAAQTDQANATLEQDIKNQIAKHAGTAG